jgi:hypothetical protein
VYLLALPDVYLRSRSRTISAITQTEKWEQGTLARARARKNRLHHGIAAFASPISGHMFSLPPWPPVR